MDKSLKQMSDAELAEQYAKTGGRMSTIRDRIRTVTRVALGAGTVATTSAVVTSCDAVKTGEGEPFCVLNIRGLDNTDSNPNNDYDLNDDQPSGEIIDLAGGINTVNITNGRGTVDLYALLPNNTGCELFDVKIEIDVLQELPGEQFVEAKLFDPLNPTQEKNTFFFEGGSLVDPNDPSSVVSSGAEIRLNDLPFKVPFNPNGGGPCDNAIFNVRVYADKDQGGGVGNQNWKLVGENRLKVALL